MVTVPSKSGMKKKYWTLEVGGISHLFDSYEEMIKHYKNYPLGTWKWGVKYLDDEK
jgi:hypothetical protein